MCTGYPNGIRTEDYGFIWENVANLSMALDWNLKRLQFKNIAYFTGCRNFFFARPNLCI